MTTTADSAPVLQITPGPTLASPEDEEPYIDPVPAMRQHKAGIPPRYRDLDWDQYRDPTVKLNADAAERFRAKLAEFKEWRGDTPDTWVAYLFAPAGRGKTMLAAIKLGRWARGGASAGLFLSVPAFLREVRDGFDARDGRSGRAVAQAKGSGLLVLDDLGAESATDWAGEMLYDVINHRYNHMKRTIITSNLTPSEIGEAHHERLGSRLGSGWGWDLSALPDFRQKRNAR
jgi:DNA replication protein DnaC